MRKPTTVTDPKRLDPRILGGLFAAAFVVFTLFFLALLRVAWSAADPVPTQIPVNTLTIEAPAEQPVLKAITVVATAYCPCKLCCGPNAHGMTSTGVDVHQRPYGIAADPHVLPYGTKLVVPGYEGNPAVVDDTGGAMRQDAKKGIVSVDLRFRTHDEALKWGRKVMTVYVMSKPAQ